MANVFSRHAAGLAAVQRYSGDACPIFTVTDATGPGFRAWRATLPPYMAEAILGPDKREGVRLEVLRDELITAGLPTPLAFGTELRDSGSAAFVVIRVIRDNPTSPTITLDCEVIERETAPLPT